MNEWHENHGELPEGITYNTHLDIEYRDGVVITNSKGWGYFGYWGIRNEDTDIIRWRYSE